MKRFLHMSYLDFKGHLGPFHLEEFLTLNALYPFLTLAFYCLLAGYAFQTTDLSQWVVGNSYLLCTNICIFSLGQCFTGERYYGRIRSIVCAPMSKLLFMVQKGFFSCLVCMGTTFAGFLAGGIVFHIPFDQINWGVYLIDLFVAMMSACAFGIFIGTFGLITDQMHFILNTMSFVLIIFTGANFPVSQLPFAGRLLSRIIPLTRSIQAGTMIFGVCDRKRLSRLLGGEVLVAAIYLLLASAMVCFAEQKARNKGTLDLF